jgi:hypothetical protein
MSTANLKTILVNAFQYNFTYETFEMKLINPYFSD